MRKILEMKPVESNNICTISCIYNVLKYYEHTITEHEVYLLVNGFQTTFYNGYVSLNTLFNVNQQLISEGKFDTTLVTHKEEKINAILQALSESEPVIIQIDSKYLKFDTRLLKQYDFIRTLLIYGADLEAKKLYLYDTIHLNEDQIPEVISFEADLDFMIEHSNELLVIHKSKEINCNYDFQKRLIEDLTEFIDTQDSSRQTGINAIKYHIEDANEKLHQEDTDIKLSTCYYATNTIIFGTFMPMFNYLIDTFNSMNQENLPDEEKEKILEELKVRKTKWNLLSNKAMKLTVTKRENQVMQFVDRYRLETQRTLDSLRNLRNDLTNIS